MSANATADVSTLTLRQVEVLQIICAFTRDKGTSPTVRDLQTLCCVNSPNGIICHLTALERKGFIVYQHKQSRGIRVTQAPPGWILVAGLLVRESEARLIGESLLSRAPRTTPELSSEAVLARLEGFDGVACPDCGSFRTVSSRGLCSCDNCGYRWEKGS